MNFFLIKYKEFMCFHEYVQLHLQLLSLYATISSFDSNKLFSNVKST